MEEPSTRNRMISPARKTYAKDTTATARVTNMEVKRIVNDYVNCLT